MPIYGYRCTSCGHEIEVLQSMRDDPLTVCEACGGRLEKKLYPVGVHFKGSGFYSTDYKRSSEKKASESKPDAKSETKADSTPASSGSETKAEKKSGSGDKTTTTKAAES